MRLFRFILDIVFPPSALVLRLREMDAQTFVAAIPHAFVIRDQNHECRILSRYKDPLVHEAIWQMKFRGDGHATELLAEGVYRLLHKTTSTEPLLIIPVPASKARIRTRGFDQCQNLTKCIKKISERSTGPHLEFAFDALQKTKRTPEQKGQKRSERLKNLEGSFEVKSDYHKLIRNRHIILIDDVLTTGATLNECRNVLLAAGAEMVTAYALAH